MNKSILRTSLFTAAMLLTTALHAEDDKSISFGIAPGPYGDLITKAIKPGLEKKGYKVTLVQFQDYVQPNLALAKGETRANLFQHQPYLEKFSADHKLSLVPVIRVPTAGLGVYSRKVKDLKELKKGDEVTLAQDPTNLARALRFLQKIGLIKIKAEIDATKASEKDIAENPHELRITPLEAAQIPRTLDTAAIAVVNGNYAIAAGLKLSEALVLEELPENLKNLVAVRAEDKNAQFVKDIVAVVESDEFHQAVENQANVFSSFQKPEWYAKKWSTPAK
ncbi:MAG: MetQ/NlpA family ABC transporter substrate-binding protein [Kiritimatiellia bacterium]